MRRPEVPDLPGMKLLPTFLARRLGIDDELDSTINSVDIAKRH
jgi:hypothetical protein